MSLWYYLRNNAPVGPISLEQLQGMVRSGELRGDAEVNRAGSPDWVQIARVPELQSPGNASRSAPNAPASAGAADLGYHSGEMMASGRAIDMLRQTGPWVRFLSILMFIGAGLFALIAFVIMVITLFALAGTRVQFFVMSLFYLAMAALYVMPAIFLTHYANGITRVVIGRQPGDLEAALQAQKSFWKYAGISAIVVISLYILIFLGVFAFGSSSIRALSHRPF